MLCGVLVVVLYGGCFVVGVMVRNVCCGVSVIVVWCMLCCGVSVVFCGGCCAVG